MGKKKRINRSYFEEESRAMFYVLGAFYGGCVPYKKKGIVFRSSQKKLVEIVRDQLKSNHSIVKDRNKSSFGIYIYKAPLLKAGLEKYGLDKSKRRRTFPDYLDETNIGHFTRGFIDSQAYIRGGSISIKYNRRFLQGLHEKLVAYAGVKKEFPSEESNQVTINYGVKDSQRIYNLIYSSDWSYTRRVGVYLKRNLEKLRKRHPNSNTLRKSEAIKRIEKAKRLLLQMPVSEVAKRLGYKQRQSINRIFEKHLGMSPTQYVNSVREAI